MAQIKIDSVERGIGDNDQIRILYTIQTDAGVDILSETFSTSAHASDGKVKSRAGIMIELLTQAKSVFLKDGRRELLKQEFDVVLGNTFPIPK